MRVVEVRWRPYAVPFAAEFATAHRGWRVREGAVVRIVTEAGVTGTGELVALPSHGTMTHTELLSLLEGAAARVIGADAGEAAARVDALLGAGAGVAPLRGAVEAAALDAMAQAAGVPLGAMLADDVARDVRVNAVVDAAGCAEAAAAAAAAEAAARGFIHVKLKVGTAGTPEAEAARVRAVRIAVGPEVRLRVDANGAWTEAQAVETLRALEAYGIELAEQPVAPGDVAAMARVRAAVRVPIAADEGMTDEAAVAAHLDARAVDAVVIKLPVAGGPSRALAMARAARRSGAGAIVTSAMETGAGVATALHVASALRPATACGLATLELLEDDLIEGALPVERGVMRVPDAPGLGVRVDEAALGRYAAGPERVVRA